MPDQTSETTEYEIPDGAQVQIDYPIGTGYIDIGEVDGDTDAVGESDMHYAERTNKGIPDPILSNQTLKGKFNLKNINYSNMELLGSGMFTKETTTASPVATISNQVIAANWTAKTKIAITAINSSTSVAYKLSAAPTLTSVTGSTVGALVDGDDYIIMTDEQSYSGYSIVLLTTGVKALPTTDTVTIVFTTVTPVASIVLSLGKDKTVLSPFGMKLVHTDSAGLTKTTEIWRCYPESGAFNFGFMGPQVKGYVTQPFSWRAVLDTSKAAGKQLMSSTKETGAV